MKRLLFTIVSVIATIGMYAETIVTVDGIKYSLRGTYAYVYGVEVGQEEIVIPASIEYAGYSYCVYAVLNGAFACGHYYDRDYNQRTGQGKSNIKKVILPNTINEIGDGAFSGASIEEVVMQEGVRGIGYAAFKYLPIVSITIPKSVEVFYQSSRYEKCSNFSGCDFLRTIIYLGDIAPSGWTATSCTYVPNLANYYGAGWHINNAHIIEMISFSENIFPYTGKAPTPTWTNNMEGYNVNLTMPALKSEVGNYEEIIPVTITKGSESYVAYIPYKYTIEPVKLIAKVNNSSRTYGEPNPNFTVTYSGFVNGENESVFATMPTVSTTASTTSNVGTYPITISDGTAKNYVFEYVQGELTVNKASLSIQVMDASKVYGANNPTFTLGYSGLKNNESTPTWVSTPVFTTNATKNSDVGTYSVSVICEAQNYAIMSNKSGILTITQAPLTIKANDASMLYCDTMPDYTYTYTGFVNDDNENVLSSKPTISTDASSISNAGTYSIKPTGAIAKNYAISYAVGTLTIKQRELTISANAASRLYGENNPEFTLKYNGFVNNETKSVLDVEPTASTTATTRSNAGTYDIGVSGGRALNYTFKYQSGILTIMPRDLKASVDNYERPYGENNPTFSIIYEGFVGNDSEASLQTMPIVRTNATKTSNVGIYNLEVTGGYSPNYLFSYGAGKLTINKAEQNFEWNQDLSNIEVGSQVELQAKASSGLPVTYIADNNDIAEVYKAGSKTYMECKSAGLFNIKAVQEGNDNYYSTQRINKKVTIVGEGEYNPTLIIKQADNGSISIKVTKGTRHTFTIHEESGWKIHSVLFNGVDVTNQLDAQNVYTTPAITESSTLNVIYRQGNNAVLSPLSPEIKILPTAKGIKVIGAAIGDNIRIYTIEGTLQKDIRTESTELEIPLNKDNVYIIKVESSTMKLSL